MVDYNIHIRNMRRYQTADGTIVVAIGGVNIVNTDGVLNGVMYMNEGNTLLETSTYSCMSVEEFLNIHVPIELEEGDLVEMVSMGRTKGIAAVETICDGQAILSSGEKLGTRIDANGQLKPLTEVQATDFRILRPNATTLKNSNLFNIIREKLDLYERTLKGNGSCNVAVQLKMKQNVEKILEILNT